MERHDRSGILGTPLPSDARSEFKISAPNKLAPTPVVYSKMRQNADIRREKSLLHKSDRRTKDDEVYIPRTRPSHLEDLMDPEDRTNLRVRAMIKRKTPNMVAQQFSAQGTALSFVAASVDLPEIVPTQARTPLAYRELQSIYSLRRAQISQSCNKARPHSDFQPSRYLPEALHQGLRTGLGYGKNGTTNGSKGDMENMKASDTARSMKGLESVQKVTDIGCDSDEEYYMNHLANYGYRNLHETEKLMSRRLKEGRTALMRVREQRKRSISDTDAEDAERFMCLSFEQWRGLDTQDEEWPEYDVPNDFAANPAHNCEKDRLKTNLNVLPPTLQEEYSALLRDHKESLSKEADNAEASISKAKEEQNEKLRKIRGLVLEDMGSRFIAAQTQQEETASKSLRSHPNVQAQDDDSVSKHPKQGETNRTSRPWKPEKLLCTRLGVEEPKTNLPSSAQEVKVSPKSSPASSHRAEEFQVHSITHTDGRRIDFSGDRSLLRDESILSQVDHNISADNNRKRPSRQLVETIFANSQVEDEREQMREGSASKETGSRIESASRGIHKTRAVDFF